MPRSSGIAHTGNHTGLSRDAIGYAKVFLPVACGQLQGLYIEMPATVQALSKEQTTWIRVLSEQGHKVNFCANSAQAINAILNYLKIERRQ